MRTEGRGAPAIVIAALVVAWTAGLAGCPGTLDDKQRFLTGGDPVACDDVLHDVFAAKCGGSGCHGATNPAQDLDLESEGLAERVVGKPATECDGILADPAAPELSILYRKVLPIGVPGCGVPMPYNRAPLSTGELACVRDWIADQAPDDAGSGDAGKGDAGHDDAGDGG